MALLKSQNNPTSPDALDILSNEIVIMFGKLKKRGKINTAWKQRWCELAFLSDELILSYYVSKRNKKLCGCIEVVNIYQIKAVDYDSNEFKDYSLPNDIQLTKSETLANSKGNNLKYTFILCTLGRDYILSANKTDFIQWIELFNKYVYPKIVYNGFLDMKKEKTLNEWNTYYFELNEYKQIKYYKNKKKDTFYGSIPLAKINKIKNGYVYDDDHVFSFHLKSDKLKKQWVLCYVNKSTNTYAQNVESKHMREIWQNEIEKICGKEKIQIIQMKRKQRAQSDLAVINPSHFKRKSKKVSKKPRLSINLSLIIPGMSSSSLTPSKHTSHANVEDGTTRKK